MVENCPQCGSKGPFYKDERAPDKVEEGPVLTAPRAWLCGPLKLATVSMTRSNQDVIRCFMRWFHENSDHCS
jgi:hypothetical protein